MAQKKLPELNMRIEEERGERPDGLSDGTVPVPGLCLLIEKLP